jgi:hypothetical protein
MEGVGDNIRNRFDNLCNVFTRCVNIIPIETMMIYELTNISPDMVQYLSSAVGVRLPHISGQKVTFTAAVDQLVESLYSLTEEYKGLICTLQTVGLEHCPVADTLLPLDLILLLSNIGHVVYDKTVCRILPGPCRAQSPAINKQRVADVLLKNNLYRMLESCFGLGDFYEYENVIFTVGSIHLCEFTYEAVKKFISDVWYSSSLR